MQAKDGDYSYQFMIWKAQNNNGPHFSSTDLW